MAEMTPERRDLHLSWLKRDAARRGFTEEEIAHFHIGGLSKQTKSPRIRRMISLAFLLGQMRAVKDVYELSQPVHFRAVTEGETNHV